jgi:hypothetical protein
MDSRPTLKEFLDGPDALAVYCENELVFQSRAGGLKPLLDLLRTFEAEKDRLGLCLLYDRFVGRAAALLISRVRPTLVLTGVVSEGGAETLTEHKIAFEAGKSVKYLMGIASEGMCRWEKMSLGMTADDFWKKLQALPEFDQAGNGNHTNEAE